MVRESNVAPNPCPPLKKISFISFFLFSFPVFSCFLSLSFPLPLVRHSRCLPSSFPVPPAQVAPFRMPNRGNRDIMGAVVVTIMKKNRKEKNERRKKHAGYRISWYMRTMHAVDAVGRARH